MFFHQVTVDLVWVWQFRLFMIYMYWTIATRSTFDTITQWLQTSVKSLKKCLFLTGLDQLFPAYEVGKSAEFLWNHMNTSAIQYCLNAPNDKQLH